SHAELLPGSLADSQAKLVSVTAQLGQEVGQKAKMIRRDLDRVGVTTGDRITAVQSLSERENRAGGGDLWRSGQRPGAEHRGEDIQLRQIDAGVAAEQPRPS